MIPLAVPNLTGREKEYLNNCIETTYVSSIGEYVNRLEQMTAQAAGSRFAVATSAGTTGLHAVLAALGVNAGELVIIPALTFIATANAIAYCGAVPWCMDISLSDWCLDSELVCSVLEHECEFKDDKVIHKESGRRVAAIMPVYTLGNIPDMKAFRLIADKYHLPLIADAACAIGAEYQSQPFGSFADASVVSFNGNKTITCGGGGMVVGDNESFMTAVRHLTTTARAGTEYDFDAIGFNYRMTNIQAAVGCAQMERLEEFIAAKRRIRKYYREQLDDLNGILFFPATEGSSCWLSGIVLPEDKTIEDVRYIVNQLKERGIESRTFWKPVHLQEPYKNSLCSDVKAAESLWGRILTLPCSTNITDKEMEFVAESVSRIMKK